MDISKSSPRSSGHNFCPLVLVLVYKGEISILLVLGVMQLVSRGPAFHKKDFSLAVLKTL